MAVDNLLGQSVGPICWAQSEHLMLAGYSATDSRYNSRLNATAVQAMYLYPDKQY